MVVEKQDYDDNSMIIIGNEEAKLIVELLVKTQKINADKNSL